LILSGRYSAVVFLGDAAYLSTWIAARLCRSRGTKVVFWTIGWRSSETGLKRWVRLRFYRMADCLLLYGERARQIGRSLGVEPRMMHVVGNSIESKLAARSCNAADELHKLAMRFPDSETEVVSAVVRLTHQRRFDLLIRAIAILQNSGRKVSIVLAGEGDAADPLEDLAVELGVDLRLVGPVYSHEALEAIYRRSALTVVPEFIGLTAIQSMTYGRPVITCSSVSKQGPEADAIRPGITGDFYAEPTAASLACGIESWLDRMKVEADAVAMACREEVGRNWSTAAHASRIYMVLQDVVNGPAAVTPR
jgi:glycosyltransferase involved in cell wall biosynthesis